MRFCERKFTTVLNKNGYPDRHIKTGDLVLDCLTGYVSKVLKVVPKTGMDAWQGDMVHIKSKHLDGYRHGWEVTKIKERKNAKPKNR